ncbi:hypothetical protein HGO34_15940 [Agrobacterium vitis]|uniref:hypothetical protein n=1 Tax=Agrobacterium vitis TaxID=373 RepID=UPI001F34E3C9|nr:hypothetical protein [Agrobacterium vitis]MCF1498884.1 hypothetical protein [Allorhizobium sp. Av2]MCM2441214.1 hypothetical protein [Agrobacterium vitis]
MAYDKASLFPANCSTVLHMEAELEAARNRERRTAMANAFHAMAYREMPADLRERGKAWGVEALMDAVWMSAFECGYKQAVRDRQASPIEGGDNGLNGWQEIASAPLDGTMVDLCVVWSNRDAIRVPDCFYDQRWCSDSESSIMMLKDVDEGIAKVEFWLPVPPLPIGQH